MNKAFFSYSLNTTEEFIVTRLATVLGENGYTLESSRNMMATVVDFNTYSSISKSNLFIGVMSVNGNRWGRVWNEYVISQAQNIPRILLVEDTFTNIPNGDSNVYMFNRHRIQETIDKVQNQLAIATQPKSNQSSVVPLLLGGAAVLGLIALLSDTEAKTNKKLQKSKIHSATQAKTRTRKALKKVT